LFFVLCFFFFLCVGRQTLWHESQILELCFLLFGDRRMRRSRWEVCLLRFQTKDAFNLFFSLSSNDFLEFESMGNTSTVK
jgi:hypothetical protein